MVMGSVSQITHPAGVAHTEPERHAHQPPAPSSPPAARREGPSRPRAISHHLAQVGPNTGIPTKKNTAAGAARCPTDILSPSLHPHQAPAARPGRSAGARAVPWIPELRTAWCSFQPALLAMELMMLLRRSWSCRGHTCSTPQRALAPILCADFEVPLGACLLKFEAWQSQHKETCRDEY